MMADKAIFFSKDFLHLLKSLDPHQEAAWGKMNAQQMVEHVAGFFDLSAEKISFAQVTAEEYLPKYLAFLYSDKEFNENTKAPASVLPDLPIPVKYADLQAATQQLQLSIEDFHAYFNHNPGSKTLHPVFGWLTYEEWILLHYKHVRHHAKQFRLLS